MSRTRLSLSFVVALTGGAALAEGPQVAVDLAPIHSLVARVMDGVGTPDLIVQQGASPHEYSLRPSDARALQDADLVFWVGAELSPWLAGAIETLASDAQATALLDASGTILLAPREGARFEKHDHPDAAGQAKDDHDDHADHEKHAHDDHAHGATDPHVWLSPTNAMTWLNVIAGQLSAADSENAGLYFANAAAGRAEIETAMGEVNAILDPVRGGQFIVFHDAYQYFEADFDFPAAGAISLSDATDPSPARITEIRALVAEQDISCVLAEPQFNASLVAMVLDGTQAKTAVLDPLGSGLELGPELYTKIVKNMATTLASCM